MSFPGFVSTLNFLVAEIAFAFNNFSGHVAADRAGCFYGSSSYRILKLCHAVKLEYLVNLRPSLPLFNVLLHEPVFQLRYRS